MAAPGGGLLPTAAAGTDNQPSCLPPTTPFSPNLPATCSSQAQAHLPIRRYQQQIIESVRANPVTVVIGETGSGKTTQISQILEEAGFAEHGMIGVTQPRRVVSEQSGERGRAGVWFMRLWRAAWRQHCVAAGRLAASLPESCWARPSHGHACRRRSRWRDGWHGRKGQSWGRR